jgi:hypothetical protein
LSLLRHFLHLAGYHRLWHKSLLLSFRKWHSGSQGGNCFRSLQLVTRFQWPKEN